MRKLCVELGSHLATAAVVLSTATALAVPAPAQALTARLAGGATTGMQAKVHERRGSKALTRQKHRIGKFKARQAREQRTRKIRVRKLSRVQHNKLIGRTLVARAGWSRGQFRCLERLWTRESGWNHRAHNGGSGAHGIPQALPGRKMASAGGDWATNPKTQIKWGLRYIKYRYGSPCGAWAHFSARNWY